MGRGLALTSSGMQKAATADFSNALNIAANDPFIYLLRADAYAKYPRFSNAISDLKKACSLGYTDVCTALKQSRSEIAGTEGSFVLQYSRKAPDEELYETSKKNLGKLINTKLKSEQDKIFSEMLKPSMD
jgi:tetratricopeptide (TPR) repeat protein